MISAVHSGQRRPADDAAIIAAGVIAALAIIALFRLVASKISEGSRWFGS
jgi:hypothetical protein